MQLATQVTLFLNKRTLFLNNRILFLNNRKDLAVYSYCNLQGTYVYNSMCIVSQTHCSQHLAAILNKWINAEVAK